MPDAQIRWMIRRDMPEVLAIEGRSFEFPWTEEDFIRCLRQRNCIGMVSENKDKLVGYMIYELHADSFHLLNLAVDSFGCRKGFGKQMMEKLIDKLSEKRRTRITLEVRETNLSAQMFFKKMGFMATSVIRDYYDDATEDAYVMQYHIERSASNPCNRISKLVR